MAKRAALYLRISETDTAVDKVDQQEKRLRKVLEREHYQLVDIYPDDGISAYLGRARSGWEGLQSDIRKGLIDVVLMDRQDRLARNSLAIELFKVVCKENGVIWQFADGTTLDPSKVMDSAMASFKGIMDQMESDIKRERLRARFDSEIELGNPLWGVRPFGYSEDPDSPRDRNGKRSKRWTVLNEDEAKEIRWAYDVVLGGGSLYSVITSWNSRGVLTTSAGMKRMSKKTGKESVVSGRWSYATVQQLLRRPRNAGIVMHRDEEQVGVEAAWPSIVTREELDAVTAILTDSKRNSAPGRRGRKPVHLGSSVIFCAVCGAVMRSGSMRAHGVSVPIYKCSSKANGGNLGERHPTVQTSLIDPLITDAVVDAFLFGPSNLIDTGEAESPAVLETELSTVRASRARIIKLVAGDLIEEGDAAGELATIKKRETELEAELADMARRNAQVGMASDLRSGLFSGVVNLDEVVAARDALAKRFEELPLPQRKELVRTLLDVRVDTGRTMERVSIVHRVVTSLNDPQVQEELDAELTAALAV